MSSTPSSNDLEQLLQLATRGDLVMFSLEYAKGNKDFQETLNANLAKKYLHNTETASDYAGQMANAFCKTKDSGDRWHSYEVTDWEAVFYEANKIVEEGKKLLCPTLEFSYKDDALGDPMINDYYAIAIGAATKEEIDTITDLVFKINDFLVEFFSECGIDLIDFKVEFGRYKGQIILADEISPDTCRFWDKKTHEKLDKDRFRRDLGNVEDAYNEVAKRIGLIK